MSRFCSAMASSWNQIACAWIVRASRRVLMPFCGASPRSARAHVGFVAFHHLEQRGAQQLGAAQRVGRFDRCRGFLGVVQVGERHGRAHWMAASAWRTVAPSFAALGATSRPWPRMISAFSAAVSPTAETIAPAWPMRRPFGAVTPAT